MAMELPALRMLKPSGSKLLVLPLSKCTFSGMSTRTIKRRPVLVSLTATDTPSTINKVVDRQDGIVGTSLLDFG